MVYTYIYCKSIHLSINTKKIFTGDLVVPVYSQLPPPFQPGVHAEMPPILTSYRSRLSSTWISPIKILNILIMDAINVGSFQTWSRSHPRGTDFFEINS